MHLMTISEAADQLGRKPWEVVRLIETGHITQVVLVDADSLTNIEESR